MVRFGHIVILYFVIGATLWAGGAIQWDEAGVGTYMINASGETVSDAGNASEDLTSMTGPVEEAASTVDSLGLLAVWNIVLALIGYFTWPITVLQSVGTPIEIVVLLGGTLQITFLVALIKVVRGSA